MSKPKTFAHVVLQTRKIDEMISWYQAVMEFDVRFRHPVMAFLCFDEEHHRIALINLMAIDPEGARELSAQMGTLEHVAFTYASAKELLNNYERLKKMGKLPFWSVHHGMTLSLYYQDPDGNRVECQVEAYADAEQANAFLATEVFMKNPIGVTFDPEVLLEKMRKGASEAELLTYTPGPMAMPPHV